MRVRSFLTVLALVSCTRLSLAAQAPQLDGFKDPGTATILSVLIIGGGQLYAGDTPKGLTLMGIGYGSLIAGEAAGVAKCTAGSCTSGGGLFLLGVGVGVVTWIYGAVDAGGTAREHNASLGQPHASLAPILMPGKDEKSPRLGLGLKLSI